MTTESQETPSFIVHALRFFILVIDHVLPPILTGGKLTLAWLYEHRQNKKVK
jgi:hypothetical protein